MFQVYFRYIFDNPKKAEEIRTTIEETAKAWKEEIEKFNKQYPMANGCNPDNLLIFQESPESWTIEGHFKKIFGFLLDAMWKIEAENSIRQRTIKIENGTNKV